MYMLLFLGFLIALCSVAIFVAGLLAYLRNSEKAENKWFFLLSGILAFWVAANFADSNLRLHESVGRLLLDIDFALAIFIGWALLQFVVVLTYDLFRNKAIPKFVIGTKFRIYSLAANALAIVLILTGHIFTIKFVSLQAVVKPAELFSVYIILVIGYLLTSIFFLLSNYIRGTIAHKRRLSLIVLGFVAATIANLLSNVIFPNLTDQRSVVEALNTIGYIGIFFLVFCVYLAITTRKLFDIKLVIARSVVYILLVGTVALFYTVSITLLSYLLVGDTKTTFPSLAASLVVTLFIASTFQYLKRSIDKLTNKILYRDTYESQEVLDRLSKMTASTTDLPRIIKQSKHLFETTLKSSYCNFMLIDKEGNISHTSGHDIATEKLKRLVTLIPRSHAPIITELLDDNDERYALLISISAELIFPLYTTDGIFGILTLGTKQNGMEYVQKDIQLLTTATSSLSVAIQNALRFEEIERFNETLQQKVDDATRGLRAANLKLKMIDRQKDDFIGMASHQLRTPLTSIKGYVSLVLDGDSGRITATQRKLLEQAFTSSQRMVYLIADLLNVSRLKTGKFMIDRVPTNLSKVISDEMAQLRTAASAHDIALTFDPPANFPTLMLDETKTRQVIMNFLDNAIYYTPNGGNIKVVLRDLPKSVEFEVDDDGIGVPKDERHHLFTKFYRAKNAQRARPDGTGLGLFMAKKVIVAQGGALIFDSKEGEGSQFGFSFPKEMPEGTGTRTIISE